MIMSTDHIYFFQSWNMKHTYIFFLALVNMLCINQVWIWNIVQARVLIVKKLGK